MSTCKFCSLEIGDAAICPNCCQYFNPGKAHAQAQVETIEKAMEAWEAVYRAEAHYHEAKAKAHKARKAACLAKTRAYGPETENGRYYTTQARQEDERYSEAKEHEKDYWRDAEALKAFREKGANPQALVVAEAIQKIKDGLEAVQEGQASIRLRGATRNTPPGKPNDK